MFTTFYNLLLLFTTCYYFLLYACYSLFWESWRKLEKVGESVWEAGESWRKSETVWRQLEQVWRRFEKTEESLDSTTSTSTSNVDIGLIGSVGIVDSSESTVKSRPNRDLLSRSFPDLSDSSDFLGRLQPSKTTSQKTLNAPGVEESSSPRKVLQF